MEDSFRFILARLAQCADSKDDPVPIHCFADLQMAILEGQSRTTEVGGREIHVRDA
jgi:hypothetical protein